MTYSNLNNEPELLRIKPRDDEIKKSEISNRETRS